MMNEKFDEQFAKLHKAIDSLPPSPGRDRLASLARDTQQRYEQIRQAFAPQADHCDQAGPDVDALQDNLNVIADALDTLRLSMAYAQFDIEAQRREDRGDP